MRTASRARPGSGHLYNLPQEPKVQRLNTEESSLHSAGGLGVSQTPEAPHFSRSSQREEGK